MKVKIKNLARITEADFELKPLTIFIGKNNTNKSYVAHVFYALFDMVRAPIPTLFNSSEKAEIFQQFKLIFKKESKGDSIIYSIEKKEKNFEKFLNLFDIVWARTFPDYLKNSFLETTVELKEKDLLRQIFNKMECRLVLYSDKNIAESIISTYRSSHKSFHIGYPQQQEKEILFDFLINIVQGLIAGYLEAFPALFYFPAARTGFSLALEDIRSGIFERYSGKPITKLSKPTIDFIISYDAIKQERSPFNPPNQSQEVKEILSFFEKQLLNGKILLERYSVENYTLKKFVYRPQGYRNTFLEFHCVSSMVTELAPIYSFLKMLRTVKNSFFIIEEPEAHLHPSAQLEMVKLLGMLVRNKARVLITTHSDYILNFINALIRSSQLSDEKRRNLKVKRKKLDLSQCYLKPEEVGCYLFKEKKKEVEVKEIEITEHGIAFDAFEEVLDEIIGISEHIDKLSFKELIEDVSE